MTMVVNILFAFCFISGFSKDCALKAFESLQINCLFFEAFGKDKIMCICTKKKSLSDV